MGFKLKSYVQRKQALIEAALRRSLAGGAPARLYLAMRYSLLAGGKRLRPILVMASAEACGARASQVLPMACAFEALHTYSLIHDDLPAMDDDDLRRGRPTCHKAFDEATAILAGDALLTLAFELASKNAGVAGVGPARAIAALRHFASAAGAAGMVGGQMADLEGESRAVGRAGLRFIHQRKTGALIQAAVVCGAVLAGAKEPQRRALAAYGQSIGLAFQVADDILNVTGVAAKMGKKTGTDKAAQKATYPGLYGLQKAREIAQNELSSALKALRLFGAKGEPLAGLARFVIQRDR